MKERAKKKKTPFLIMIRQGDWPDGLYQLLPGDAYANTAEASRCKSEVLKSAELDIPGIVRKAGLLRVCIVNFTEVSDCTPTMGYEEQARDPFQEIPMQEGSVPTLSELANVPITPLPRGKAAPEPVEASSSVDLGEGEATPLKEENVPEETQEPQEEQEEGEGSRDHFWDSVPNASEPTPGVAKPETPPAPAPQGSGKTADGIIL